MQYRKYSNKRLRAFWKLKNVIIFSMQVYGTSNFRDKF